LVDASPAPLACRHRQGFRRPASGSCSGSCSCSRASASRSRPCRPHVDAGRLRRRADADHGFSRPPQGSPHRHVRAHHDRRLPEIAAQWQQIVVLVAIARCRSRLPAIASAISKRLMAYSSIGHMGFALVGSPPAPTEGVQGVSSTWRSTSHDARHVRLHPRDIAANGQLVEEIGDLAGLAQTKPAMAFFWRCCCSRRGRARRWPASSQIYVFSPPSRLPIRPRRDNGVIASVVGAYYYLLIVKIMYSTSRRPRSSHAASARVGARCHRPVQRSCSSSIRACSSKRPPWRQIAV